MFRRVDCITRHRTERGSTRNRCSLDGRSYIWRGAAVLRLVDRRWNDSEILAEHAAEMGRTRKAPRKRHIRDRFSGLALQLLTTVLQPCLPHIVAHGHASVTEQHVQITLGAAQRRGDLVDAKLRVAQMFADEELSPDVGSLGTATIERGVGLAKRQ